MTKKPKKRNPADSTLRNVRAANKKFTDLKQRVKECEKQIETLKALWGEMRRMVHELEEKKK